MNDQFYLAIQLTWNGVVEGSMYALIALGFSLIWFTARVLYFAQGAMVVLASYLVFTLTDEGGTSWELAAALTVLLMILVGLFVEGAIYLPMRRRKSSAQSMFIVGIGLMLLVVSGLGFIFGASTRFIGDGPSAKAVTAMDGRLFFNYADMIALPVFVGLTAVVLVLLYTPVGRTLRAIIDDPPTAELIGVPIERFNLFAFAAGSALTVPVATYLVLTGGVNSQNANNLMVIALAAIIVGGLGNIVGVVIGGFVLGLVKNLAFLAIPPIFGDAVVFVVLMLFIVLRPRGILPSRLTKLST